jgi:hypothetical protein
MIASARERFFDEVIETHACRREACAAVEQAYAARRAPSLRRRAERGDLAGDHGRARVLCRR